MGLSRFNYKPQIPSDAWAYVCAYKAFPERRVSLQDPRCVSISVLNVSSFSSAIGNVQDNRPGTIVVHYPYSVFLTYLP